MSAIAASNILVRLGRRLVVDGVNFSVAKGEMVGLIGANGAGKTSVIKTLAGLLTAASGEVVLQGRPLGAFTGAERARRIAYFAQGAVCHWPLTVERLVALGRLPHLAPWCAPGDNDRRAVGAALAAADLADFAARPVDQLSQGERTRALLARALAVEAPVLLADEPVAALDPRHQLQIMQTLATQAAKGAGVLVVLHDLSLAARFCHRLVLLKEGRVLADGRPADVLTADYLVAAYGILAEIGRRDGSLYVVPWDVVPGAVTS
jgi:iron complex transport system ATP-binding protein